MAFWVYINSKKLSLVSSEFSVASVLIKSGTCAFRFCLVVFHCIFTQSPVKSNHAVLPYTTVCQRQESVMKPIGLQKMSIMMIR